jgi:hypothetical protein
MRREKGMRKRGISIAMIFMLALVLMSAVTTSAAIRTVTIRVTGMT